MSRTPGSGGFSIPANMKALLDQTLEFINSDNGGDILRIMYQDVSAHFSAKLLSNFVLACYLGSINEVKKLVTSGAAPDLTGHETGLRLGYLALTVLGASRVISGPKESLQHFAVVRYLLECGAPPDVPDICGLTALFHACTPPNELPGLAMALLQGGANPNHRNRYGETAIFFPLQGENTRIMSILIKNGADMTLPDANGDTPDKLYVNSGAKMTAAVRKAKRELVGEQAPLDDRKCASCHKRADDMKRCSRCQTVLYCSTDCQVSHWQTHKVECQSFSGENTVTLKPTYMDGGHAFTMSTSDIVRRAMGTARDAGAKFDVPFASTRGASEKSMVIKVQSNLGQGPLLVYNKKRDLNCYIHRSDNPRGYDEIVKVIRAKGPMGLKAYFAAQLKSKDELVIKISEVLAEQPF
ncbi:ankyrin [Coniophora puteana RWD-64-598 SS2]|uniref:Ankyrin n=1 Tax=Coniophora puteana (strain RWD-64-598) TaxID=741705 RepID=A0A5M3MGI8_CONPW|nr:ankyrin [Coniophora puteana RWD-64-598 SS2]EIW78283.1 ankyrin [Coniophora puteana RWD-64-598 SS2]